jgi:hypothetical protein
MIYDQVDNQGPIKQGDIFVGVPRADFSAAELTLIEQDECRQTTWSDTLADGSAIEGVAAIIPIKAVMAIVISQNCDTARGEFISLCQIDKFSAVVSTTPTTPKKWASLIVRHSRDNLRYFYLPQDVSLGINERMAADLRILLRVRRADLEGMLSNRICRLNHQGKEHFRESISQYFRRYPYDEWYTLNKEEFEEYENGSVEPIERFPWQL